MVYAKKCMWFSCNSNPAEVSLFCIPEDKTLSEQWIKNIAECYDESHLESSQRRIYICENHFQPEDFVEGKGRKRIKPTAIPVVKSGSNEEYLGNNESTEDSSDRIIFNDDNKEHIVVELGIDMAGDDGTEEDEANSKESKDNSVLCLKCSIEFTNYLEFRRHWRELHKDQAVVYTCTRCKRQYKDARKLRKHKFVAHEEVKQSCPICHKMFGSGYLWKLHIRNHDANKPFTCKQCDKSFLTSFRLTKHSRTHIPLSERMVYECDLCSQKFASRSGWESHASLHTGSKDFVCDVCKKTFRTKGGMTCHKMTHTGARPFPCLKCDKTFRSKSHLVVHDRLHTNTRPYACSNCPKSFMRRDVWKKHLAMHKNIRNYKCRYCEKAFRTSDKLNVHERIHTGERPYKCDRCPSAFYESGNLRKHMQKVHKLVDKLPPVSLNDEVPLFGHTIFHNAIQSDQTTT